MERFLWNVKRKAPWLAGGLFFLIFSTSVFAAEIRYDNGGRRDPFTPLIGPNGALTYKFNPTDLNIEGIIYDPRGTSLVLLNGEFYKEGQTVKNATVISIFKDRVLLRQEDEEKTIWLRDEILDSSKSLQGKEKGGA